MTLPKVEQRLDSFRKSKKINNRSYKWRYIVISSDHLALMGFYYDPIEQNGEVLRDAINCIYCQRHSHNLGWCRSKNKDEIETLSNILLLHLHGNNLNCPYTYLRWKMIKDHKYNMGTSNWKDDPIFSDPFSLMTRNIFRTSFIDAQLYKWSPENINDVVNAGLIRYDESLTGFDRTWEHQTSSNENTFFCIYCKCDMELLPNEDVKPIEKHYLVSHNGHCYFFKKLTEDFPDFKNMKRLHEFNIIDETDKNSSMDSVIHNSLLYENLTTKENISESGKEEVDTTENETNNLKSMTQILTDAILNKNKDTDEKQEQDIEEIKPISQVKTSPGKNVSNISLTKTNLSETETSAVQSPDKVEKSIDNESSTFNDEPTEDNDPSYTEEGPISQENDKEPDEKISTQKKSKHTGQKDKSDHNDENADSEKNIQSIDNPPVRKKRKLMGQSPQRIHSKAETTFGDGTSEEPSNVSNNKDLILNFNEHVNRRKDITRNNKILDDSTDDFSFSDNGTNAFNISALENIESLSPHKKLVPKDADKNAINTLETDKLNNTDSASPLIKDNSGEDKTGNTSPSEKSAEENAIGSHSPVSPNVDPKHDNQSLLRAEDSNIKFDNFNISNDNISTTTKNNSSTNKSLSQINYNSIPLTPSKINQSSNKSAMVDAAPQKLLSHTKEKETITTANPFPIETNPIAKTFPAKTPIKNENNDLPEELSTPTRTLKLFGNHDSESNNLKVNQKKTIGRTLSGANMTVSKNTISEEDLKEKLKQITIENDFLTSDSSSNDSSSSNIPTPKVNDTTSPSFLSPSRESSYRQLRQV